MYNSVIEVETKDTEKLLKALAPELKKTRWERSSFDVEEKENKLTFKIKANDIAALRLTLNSLTQLLAVYEKTEKLLKEK